MSHRLKIVADYWLNFRFRQGVPLYTGSEWAHIQNLTKLVSKVFRRSTKWTGSDIFLHLNIFVVIQQKNVKTRELSRDILLISSICACCTAS